MSTPPVELSTVVAVVTVIFASMAFYLLAGRMGRSSQGSGYKYAPFTGGEELPQSRGKYHSELFVYAALFVAFEVFALLLASAIRAADIIWPLVFTAAGGICLFVAVIWFVGTGGSQLA